MNIPSSPFFLLNPWHCHRQESLPFYLTPLQVAAFNGQDKVVQVLLDKNAKIEALGQSHSAF
jgi:hypothetical protein